MIIRNEKPRPNIFNKKEVVRYALFPTRLKRGIDDKDGEIIWLEKYVSIYIHKKGLKNTWTFERSLRLSVHVLDKLSEEASDTGGDSPKDSNPYFNRIGALKAKYNSPTP